MIDEALRQMRASMVAALGLFAVWAQASVRQHGWIIGVVLCAMVACKETTSVSNPLPAGRIFGNWSLVLTDTAGCGTPASTTDTLTLYLTISPTQYRVFTFLDEATSTWSNDTVSGWASGFFPLQFDRGALVNLASGSYSPGVSPTSTGELFGVVDTSLTLRGSFRDPVASGQSPLLGSQPCTYRALAHHQ